MKMKLWKGYHLNGARLPKAETEENVEVLQSTETIYKRLILKCIPVASRYNICEKDYDDKINYAITLQIYNIIKLLHDKESAIDFENYSSLFFVEMSTFVSSSNDQNFKL